MYVLIVFSGNIMPQIIIQDIHRFRHTPKDIAQEVAKTSTHIKLQLHSYSYTYFHINLLVVVVS